MKMQNPLTYAPLFHAGEHLHRGRQSQTEGVPENTNPYLWAVVSTDLCLRVCLSATLVLRIMGEHFNSVKWDDFLILVNAL